MQKLKDGFSIFFLWLASSHKFLEDMLPAEVGKLLLDSGSWLQLIFTLFTPLAADWSRSPCCTQGTRRARRGMLFLFYFSSYPFSLSYLLKDIILWYEHEPQEMTLKDDNGLIF